jgi:hypothetical protein
MLFWDYLYYNIKNGLLEAELHGRKIKMLRENDYESLRQCSTLFGLFKINKRYETSFKYH